MGIKRLISLTVDTIGVKFFKLSSMVITFRFFLLDLYLEKHETSKLIDRPRIHFSGLGFLTTVNYKDKMFA